jgi:hypothetical protein
VKPIRYRPKTQAQFRQTVLDNARQVMRALTGPCPMCARTAAASMELGGVTAAELVDAAVASYGT